MKKPIVFLMLAFSFMFRSSHAQAFEDPTGSKPFVPWLWQDQLKPTIKTAGEPTGLSIMAAGVLSTVTAHQLDPDVENGYGANRHMPPSISRYGSIIGSGMPGISIAVIQLFVDQKNGLSHARSLLLTSATAITIAEIAHRERPNHSDHLSFPSGHTSSAFTTATSLAYEYGPWVGVPAFTLASFVGASRIADDDHWFSDVIAAAALGIFWSRASHNALVRSGAETHQVSVVPVIIPGGGLVSFTRAFSVLPALALILLSQAAWAHFDEVILISVDGLSRRVFDSAHDNPDSASNSRPRGQRRR